ncbi:carboxylesterase/lipase family protein [Streptomyces sp. NPDC004629]|uniref:carboxylesterase/lipase family protein n=1 Tax=Streptomyces sp. NPDC004629 TaxID=3364705 RepID=UPI0036C12C6F
MQLVLVLQQRPHTQSHELVAWRVPPVDGPRQSAVRAVELRAAMNLSHTRQVGFSLGQRARVSPAILRRKEGDKNVERIPDFSERDDMPWMVRASVVSGPTTAVLGDGLRTTARTAHTSGTLNPPDQQPVRALQLFRQESAVVTISIPFGSVRGETVRSPFGDAEQFLGITYAEHRGRFLAPGAPPRWSGLLDARLYGPACPQEPSRVIGWKTHEQRCLHLNVWRPADRQAKAPLPVMVWIHGGAHLYGHNASPVTAGARLAARHNAIIVTPNYRLGALGHLVLDHLLGPHYADAANVALLDLVAALKWTQRAAPALGGDSGAVTVFGQSAGGANVAALLAMPAARGLFHRAVIESGTGDRAQSRDYGRRRTADLLALCDLDEQQAAELLTLPVDQLIAAQQALVHSRNPRRPNMDITFQPTLDPHTLPSVPVDAIAAGASSDVDLIIGTNRNEASGYVPLDTPDDAVDPSLLPLLARADFPHVDDLPTRLSERLHLLLGRPARPGELVEAYLAEQIYREPSQRLLDARRTAQGRTYAYLFTWNPPHNHERRGAAHSLEIPFLFQTHDLPDAREEVGTAPPQGLADALGAYWTSFARTGVPTAPDQPRWEPYVPARRATALLDDPVRMADDPLRPVRELLARP